MNTRATVLVADVDASTRLLVSSLLKKYNYHVIKGKNGAEALSLFASHKPSLIIIDLNMPLLNGCQTSQAIRKMADGDKCTIILFTAEDMETITNQTECLSVDNIVTKKDIQHLHQLIRTYYESRTDS